MLRAEIKDRQNAEKKASKNKTDITEPPEAVSKAGFADKMFLHPENITRLAILDEVYASFPSWPDRPKYPTNDASLCTNADGDMRGDISAIHQDEDHWTERRLAFQHIYGLEYEVIKNAIAHHSDKLDLLVKMCNIRGTVQVRLPRSEPEDRKDMENIRVVCDKAIGKWDGRSTEYWNTPQIEALVDDLQEGLGGWVVLPSKATR